MIGHKQARRASAAALDRPPPPPPPPPQDSAREGRRRSLPASLPPAAAAAAAAGPGGGKEDAAAAQDAAGHDRGDRPEENEEQLAEEEEEEERNEEEEKKEEEEGAACDDGVLDYLCAAAADSDQLSEWEEPAEEATPGRLRESRYVHKRGEEAGYGEEAAVLEGEKVEAGEARDSGSRRRSPGFPSPWRWKDPPSFYLGNESEPIGGHLGLDATSVAMEHPPSDGFSEEIPEAKETAEDAHHDDGEAAEPLYTAEDAPPRPSSPGNVPVPPRTPLGTCDNFGSPSAEMNLRRRVSESRSPLGASNPPNGAAAGFGDYLEDRYAHSGLRTGLKEWGDELGPGGRGRKTALPIESEDFDEGESRRQCADPATFGVDSTTGRAFGAGGGDEDSELFYDGSRPVSPVSVAENDIDSINPDAFDNAYRLSSLGSAKGGRAQTAMEKVEEELSDEIALWFAGHAEGCGENDAHTDRHGEDDAQTGTPGEFAAHKRTAHAARIGGKSWHYLPVPVWKEVGELVQAMPADAEGFTRAMSDPERHLAHLLRGGTATRLACRVLREVWAFCAESRFDGDQFAQILSEMLRNGRVPLVAGHFGEDATRKDADGVSRKENEAPAERAENGSAGTAPAAGRAAEAAVAASPPPPTPRSPPAEPGGASSLLKSMLVGPGADGAPPSPVSVLAAEKAERQLAEIHRHVEYLTSDLPAEDAHAAPRNKSAAAAAAAAAAASCTRMAVVSFVLATCVVPLLILDDKRLAEAKAYSIGWELSGRGGALGVIFRRWVAVVAEAYLPL